MFFLYYLKNQTWQFYCHGFAAPKNALADPLLTATGLVTVLQKMYRQVSCTLLQGNGPHLCFLCVYVISVYICDRKEEQRLIKTPSPQRHLPRRPRTCTDEEEVVK